METTESLSEIGVRSECFLLGFWYGTQFLNEMLQWVANGDGDVFGSEAGVDPMAGRKYMRWLRAHRLRS